MKYLLALALLLAFSTVQSQDNKKPPEYIGQWKGAENKFKRTYILIFNDSNLLLIRNGITAQKVKRADTIVFNYLARQAKNGYDIELTAPKAIENKDKKLKASFKLARTRSQGYARQAEFSVDFEDGSKTQSKLKLTKL